MGRIIRSVVNTLLPVVLSAVGFIFAGPLGAALGAGVGAFLGGKIAPRQRVSGGGVSTRLTLDPKAAQVLVVGETIAPAQLIYWGTEGSDNKFLSMIVAHAAVPITAYGALKLDDVDVALSNGAATSPDRWRALLTVQRHLGAGASAFTSVAPAGKWTSAHAGRGLALQHFRMTYDGKRSQTGIPQNVAQVVKGSAVYDPRRDSTVGGTGAMRANDQATWAYSAGGVDIGRNPALVELTYRLGWRQNGRVKAGMGEDPANIDYASYIFAANICAQDVGGRPRYTIDGALSLLDDHNTNLSRIHECAGARPIDTGGLIGIWVALDDTANVILDLTPDDFVDDLGWTPVPPVETRRNTATGTYADPTNSYQQRDYPPVEPAELLADDNGQALRDTLDFTMVTDVNQARALADLALRESRQGELTLTTNLRALGLRPADVVAVTHPRWNWDDKTFRIESWALQPQALRISMRLREIAAADYAPVQVVAVSTPAPPNTLGFLPPVIESFADLPGEVDYATQVGGAGKPALYATRNEDAGNLIPDPISLSEVYSSDPPFIYREVIQGGNPGRLADVYRVRASASSGTYFGWTDPLAGLIAVSAADTVYFRVAVYIDSDAVGNISLLFNLYGGSKNYVGTAVPLRFVLSNEIQGQWKTYSGSFVVPSNVSYIWPYIGQDSRTSGFVYFAEPYVGRVQPGATYGAPGDSPVGTTTASALVAQAASASANSLSALATIAGYSSDSLLTPLEKGGLITAIAQIDQEYARLEAAAAGGSATVSGSAQRAAATSAYNALKAFLASLSPAWNNRALDTPIVRATYDGRFGDYRFAVQNLANLISADAATRATWSNVAGSGKPEDNATNDRGDDTRDDNFSPDYYRQNWLRRYRTEFKSRATVSAPGTTVHGALLTYAAWPDDNGGPVVQEFRSENGVYLRRGTSTGWGAWVASFDEANVPNWNSHVSGRPAELTDGTVIDTRNRASRLRTNGRALGNLLPTGNNSGATSVLTTTPISGLTSTSVTIAPHTRYILGRAVTYNGGTISGLNPSTRYYIYADDPDELGGSVGYLATTDFSIISGENRIYFGPVTTAAAGDGGAGGVPPPADFCVDVAMFVGPDKRAGSVELGDLLWSMDDAGTPQGLRPVCSAEADLALCQCLATENRASVVVSWSAPLWTLNRGIIRAIEAAPGDVVMTRVCNADVLSPLVGVEKLGWRGVRKIHIQGISYAAGTTPDAMIYTHNPTYKP